MKDIQQSYWQENKPDVVDSDYNGTKIEEGKRVAFNYQGSVRLGTIIKLVESKWIVRKYDTKRWSLVFELHILGDGAERVSKIKNPNSIAII